MDTAEAGPSGEPKHNSFTVCGTRFDVDSRYEIIEMIGRGAYGVVCSALDKITDELVAVKKISGVFNEQNNIVEAKRTLREMLLLRHLQHENVCGIMHVMLPPPHHDVYLVSEKMDSDMQKVIQSDQPITDDHCR